jgi:hypothetical protein
MIDLTEIAKEAGLMHRTLLSPAAWETFNEGGELQGREFQQRLFGMLETLHIALTRRKGPKEKVIYFSAFLGDGGNRANKLILKAAVENNLGQPIITVMLSNEEAGGKTSEEGEMAS